MDIPITEGVNVMTRNSARPSLLAVVVLLFSFVYPVLAPAQAVSFIAHKDFRSGNTPLSVAEGDFNGDGVQDLAVAIYHDNTVSWQLAKDDGTFLPAQPCSVGT